MISLTVLVITFGITALCTFFIILSAGRLQKKKNSQSAPIGTVEGDRDKRSSVAGENTSPRDSVKLKRAVPCPRNSSAAGGRQTPWGATPTSINYGGSDIGDGGSSSGSGSDSVGGVLDGEDVVTPNAVYFTDSSTSKHSGKGEQRRGGDGADESSPLLVKDGASSARGGDELESEESAADFQFGVLMENSGLWYRDISGRHLIRFIVLLLLLLFSSLVVREGSDGEGEKEGGKDGDKWCLHSDCYSAVGYFDCALEDSYQRYLGNIHCNQCPRHYHKLWPGTY